MSMAYPRSWLHLHDYQMVCLLYPGYADCCMRMISKLRSMVVTSISIELVFLQALKEACAALDADMRDPRRCGFDASHSGTTACAALFAGSQLLVANTGERRTWSVTRK